LLLAKKQCLAKKQFWAKKQWEECQSTGLKKGLNWPKQWETIEKCDDSQKLLGCGIENFAIIFW
jgi:hypothetical protein